jgi:hypothetical protein
MKAAILTSGSFKNFGLRSAFATNSNLRDFLFDLFNRSFQASAKPVMSMKSMSSRYRQTPIQD